MNKKQLARTSPMGINLPTGKKPQEYEYTPDRDKETIAYEMGRAEATFLGQFNTRTEMLVGTVLRIEDAYVFMESLQPSAKMDQFCQHVTAIGSAYRTTVYEMLDGMIERLQDTILFAAAWQRLNRECIYPDDPDFMWHRGIIHVAADYAAGARRMIENGDGGMSLIQAIKRHESLEFWERWKQRKENAPDYGGRPSAKDDLLTTEARELKKTMSNSQIVNHLRQKWKNSTDSEEIAALALISRKPDDKESLDIDVDAAARDLIKKRLKRG